ncbi:hypothetical protein Sjap_001869 [Stephania japonica]|uniref:Holliday junction resolvase MOC1, chloroplastic n=1 Tax=Stephania japonica TaxID=461633 RepID=A0AAP0PTX8_9MAGN
METLQIPPNMSMSMSNSGLVGANLRAALAFAVPKFFRSTYCASSSSSLSVEVEVEVEVEAEVKGNGGRIRRKSGGVKKGGRSKLVSDSELKQNWLSSLSCPLPLSQAQEEEEEEHKKTTSEWVIGIDPDVSGALALLKTHHHHSPPSSENAKVFDTPHLQVLVGKRVRKRLDAKAIVELLRTFDAPPGTTAFIEQSIPFPQDGKQVDTNPLYVFSCAMKGWWCGGFGYGLWIGILVASGFTVVPVPSSIWKSHFELCGSRSLKDESRNAACSLFPSMASLLKRKKDHGRAEALLIAAYGRSRQTKSET